MKKIRGLLYVIVAAVIIAALTFFASSKTDSRRGAVTLWYVEKSPLDEAIKYRAGQYNSLSGRAGLPVELRAFETEEALAKAFEISSPDLLLCTHLRAFSLEKREKLTDIAALLSVSPNYSQKVLGRNTCVGKSFFPIGFEIPLLVVNDSLCDKRGFDSLEAMLTEASRYTGEAGKQFFGCDSFSDLFVLTMLRIDKEFGADLENESGKQYIDLYNLLARSAFEGSMYTGAENCARYVSAGALPCAIVSSSALAKLNADGISVFDVPPPINYVNHDTLGTAIGLAVTNGGSRSTDDIAAFISWLFEGGKCAEAALNAALAPAESAEYAADNAVSAALIDITQTETVALTDSESDYCANSESFDESFRCAMEKLLP